MTDAPPSALRPAEIDYASTLFLPQTDFPMRAGLPAKEPELLARWAAIDLYGQLRAEGQGRPKFVLHDGPPYANGNIHIGHALNKILKDIVTKSQQMLGRDSDYVPGWDCHGLPIEWKIEEEYRSKGRNKDAVPVVEFRRQCRAFAQGWLDVQREEFKRLGIVGDWDHPYATMAFHAEATIAREIMKFAASGLLYRGSKPVMWSVVEKTALAEAEVEYEDYTSDTIFAAFPCQVVVRDGAVLDDRAAAWNALAFRHPAGDAMLPASVVIWTTTPWTMPGNRAIAFSSRVSYGLYRVTEAAVDNWAKTGMRYVLADSLAAGVFKAARVEGFRTARRRFGRGAFGRCLRASFRRDPAGLRVHGPAPRRRSCDGRGRYGLRSHGAGARPRGFRPLARIDPEPFGPQHRSAYSLYGRCRWGADGRRAGLRGQARADRQGCQGRCQRRRHGGAGRGRDPGGARQAQTFLSA